jgi:hypothetical protein
MDLDALQAKWMQYDTKLDAVIRMNRQLLADVEMKPARKAMGWLTASLVIDVLWNVTGVLLLGSFIGDHAGMPRFAVPAIALDVVAIALMIDVIAQVVVARQIDYSQPVAVIQKHIETLQVLRIRYVQALLVVAVLAWPALLIVMMKAFFGLDAYAMFGAAYIWENVLVGLAVIPLAVWGAKKIGDRRSDSPLVRSLVRTISGSGVNAAADALAKVAAFSREEPA